MKKLQMKALLSALATLTLLQLLPPTSAVYQQYRLEDTFCDYRGAPSLFTMGKMYFA